jgi:hypothetical protein
LGTSFGNDAKFHENCTQVDNFIALASRRGEARARDFRDPAVLRTASIGGFAASFPFRHAQRSSSEVEGSAPRGGNRAMRELILRQAQDDRTDRRGSESCGKIWPAACLFSRMYFYFQIRPDVGDLRKDESICARPARY